MARVTKALLIALTVLLAGTAMAVEGGRDLEKKPNEKAEHPQSFLGGFPGVLPFPTPGVVGLGGPRLGSSGSSFFCPFPGLNCVVVQQPTVPGGRNP
ncbi:hypothetical protein Nepgr_001642 [Nepenthes gracilis]|uniref:Uncharacterized protein n=1 Tax=Nepenthes gracilis TaxID=150966 RepID=A0AAD3P5G2_NEPGR|nr:hypothetical protein Nepgr_001642 [Nepenthes gracilis]